MEPMLPYIGGRGNLRHRGYVHPWRGVAGGGRHVTGKTVECTFHFGTFDVTTGEPTGMPCEIALKTYPVTIVDGNVQIEV